VIQIFLKKKVKIFFSETTIKKIVKLAAKIEYSIRGKIEIIIVTDKEIKNLNRIYRGINKATDVLSFAWEEKLTKKLSIPTSSYLGQIYICPQVIKKQAKYFKVDSKQEFVRMLIHGLLHLVGYDHISKSDASRMFTLQEKIVDIVLRKIIFDLK